MDYPIVFEHEGNEIYRRKGTEVTFFLQSNLLKYCEIMKIKDFIIQEKETVS